MTMMDDLMVIADSLRDFEDNDGRPYAAAALRATKVHHKGVSNYLVGCMTETFDRMLAWRRLPPLFDISNVWQQCRPRAFDFRYVGDGLSRVRPPYNSTWCEWVTPQEAAGGIFSRIAVHCLASSYDRMVERIAKMTVAEGRDELIDRMYDLNAQNAVELFFLFEVPNRPVGYFTRAKKNLPAPCHYALMVLLDADWCIIHPSKEWLDKETCPSVIVTQAPQPGRAAATPPAISQEMHDWEVRLIREAGQTVLTAWNFLHCKTTRLETHEPPEKVNKKRAKRGVAPLRAHHTLTIPGLPSAAEARTGRRIEVPLHLVRGHFRTYKKGSVGLFGRLMEEELTLWIEGHTRGNARHGVRSKDYRVAAPGSEEGLAL